MTYGAQAGKADLAGCGRVGWTGREPHQALEERLRQCGKQYTVVLLSEIFPAKLALFRDLDA